MSDRSNLIHELPCVCCKIRGMSQPRRTEEHHLLIGGNAGQKRRGEEYSAAICSYHHRGRLPVGMNRYQAQTIYGPALTDGSKLFRQVFPDDEGLLALTNKMLEEL